MRSRDVRAAAAAAPVQAIALDPLSTRPASRLDFLEALFGGAEAKDSAATKTNISVTKDAVVYKMHRSHSNLGQGAKDVIEKGLNE